MNYLHQMETLMRDVPDRAALLLHSCCAVCSSSVLERLAQKFRVTVFYFNPNIFPDTEYQKRKAEQQRLIDTVVYPNPVGYIDGDYNHAAFLELVRGLEAEPEGGRRCARCFELRLRETAQRAAQDGIPFFATTLTVSPHKNSTVINEIGLSLAREYGVIWLPSDFKRQDGYLRSIQLARQYNLYRQKTCGCEYPQQGEPD